VETAKKHFAFFFELHQFFLRTIDTKYSHPGRLLRGLILARRLSKGARISSHIEQIVGNLKCQPENVAKTIQPVQLGL
jgi:hypothetical protein